MYLDFHGLIEKPFSLTPDPKYFFASGCHAEARDLLRYGVREREGFMCFAGAAGTGKTTLLRTVLDGFGDDIVTAIVLNPYLSEQDLLRIILQDFGVATRAEFEGGQGREASKQELVDRLNEYLIGLSMQGRAAVLVVDEAQNLPLPVMEQIRLLSNLETSKQKLLQIVLAGQLGLRRLLSAPELSQLAQRVSVRYTLQPFGRDEIGRYIDHRLRIAGSDGDVVFDDAALDRLHRYTEGVPRLVNLLADRALLAGYAQQNRSIDAGVIDRAATTLDLNETDAAPIEPAAPMQLIQQPTSPQSSRFAKPTQALAGVVLAAAISAAGYTAWNANQTAALVAPPPARAEGSLSAAPNEVTFGGGNDVVDLAMPQKPFTVYLSSFRQPDDEYLLELRGRLQEAGYGSFLIGADVPGMGTMYRLTVGEFDDQASARATASKLKESGLAHAEAVAVADATGS
ncbi:MAG TPA: AAA family ATPase [Acidobacteriota bacterium]|nr:AAA family ATPase [Acidobacteriota bacterium]